MAIFTVPVTLTIDAESRQQALDAALSAMMDAFRDYEVPTGDPAMQPEFVNYRVGQDIHEVQS